MKSKPTSADEFPVTKTSLRKRGKAERNTHTLDCWFSFVILEEKKHKFCLCKLSKLRCSAASHEVVWLSKCWLLFWLKLLFRQSTRSKAWAPFCTCGKVEVFENQQFASVTQSARKGSKRMQCPKRPKEQSSWWAFGWFQQEYFNC